MERNDKASTQRQDESGMLDMQEALAAQHKSLMEIRRDIGNIVRDINAISQKSAAWIPVTTPYTGNIDSGKWEGILSRMEAVIIALSERSRKGLRVRIEGRNLLIISTVAVALILGALGIGMWASASAENRRLKANDLKYRYQQLINPMQTLYTDTLYIADPESFRMETERKEAKKWALEQAERIAAEQEHEAIEAREKVDKLKKQVPF